MKKSGLGKKGKYVAKVSRRPSRTTNIMSGYLFYNTQHKVLICKEHGHAVSAKSIVSHFRDEHDVTKEVRQGIINYASHFTIVESKELIYSMKRIKPVTYLKIVKGYVCGYMECDTVCGTVDTVKEHCKRDYGWKAKDGNRWVETQVQTFFQGNDRRYVDNVKMN
jgi:hypothetical protein